MDKNWGYCMPILYFFSNTGSSTTTTTTTKTKIKLLSLRTNFRIYLKIWQPKLLHEQLGSVSASKHRERSLELSFFQNKMLKTSLKTLFIELKMLFK